MTKGELITEIAQQTKLTKKEAAEFVDSFISSVTKAVKKGESVQLIGFGSFSLAKRAARTGRNPQTGEKIEIAASKSVKFVAGKALKDACNGK